MKRVLDGFLDGCLVATFVVMLMAAILQVFFRYVLNAPLFGSEEIGLLALVWVSFLGSAIATRDDAHIQIDFLVERLRPRLAALARLVSDVATLAFAVLLLVLGARLARFSLPFESGALRFSMTWFHAALPVSAFLMTLYCCGRIFARLIELRTR
jgi:TRAP-type C4-dicarboxylate transport system permease small subunit